MNWFHEYGHLVIILQVFGLYGLFAVDRFKLKLLWRWYIREHDMNGEKKKESE